MCRKREGKADYLNRTEQGGYIHTHTSGYPAAVLYRERGRGEGVTLREIYIKTGHTQTPTDSRLRKTEKQRNRETEALITGSVSRSHTHNYYCYHQYY